MARGTPRHPRLVHPTMNLHGGSARTRTAPWPRCGPTSAPGSRGLRRGRCRISRRSSGSTGPAPTGPRTWSCTTAPRPRTSHRRRCCPRSGRSTGSTGAVRSGRGSTGSSSTGPSTGRGPGSCGPWSASPRWSLQRPGAPRRPALTQPVLAALGELSPEHRAVIVLRHLLEYSPREIARMLDLPRGTVNSRLRRGLERAGRPARGRRGHAVTEVQLRRALLGIQPPDELGATRRSWQLARAAFDEREPTPWPRRHARLLCRGRRGDRSPRRRP